MGDSEHVDDVLSGLYFFQFFVILTQWGGVGSVASHFHDVMESCQQSYILESCKFFQLGVFWHITLLTLAALFCKVCSLCVCSESLRVVKL